MFKNVQSVSVSDEDESKPVHTMTVCGSITNWTDNNPSFCVYDLDKETLIPVARQTYSFDLEKANSTGTIEWQMVTDWLNTYHMETLSP